MMNNCPVCGKRHCIHWPEHWVYRRGKTYYCSEQCLSVDLFRDTVNMRDARRKRRGSKLAKLTLEMKKKAVQIAIDGGDPLKYLSDCGYTAPEKMWGYIKSTLKDKDPETYAKIPDRRKAKKPETPEQAQVKAETPEQPTAKPLTFDGMEISAVRHQDLGEFYYDKKFNSIDWRAPDGAEVSLGPAWWKDLVRDLPKVLKLLGVDM